MAKDRTFSKHIVTVPSGAAVSNAFDLGTEAYVSLVVPAAWTAAVLQFDASFDGGTTWVRVHDDTAGAVVSLPDATVQAALGRALVDAGTLRKLGGLNKLRLASGATGAPVNQGADRVFTVFTKTP